MLLYKRSDRYVYVSIWFSKLLNNENASIMTANSSCISKDCATANMHDPAHPFTHVSW